MFDSVKFHKLEEVVFSAARTARDRQAAVHRSYKKDGSVLTEADLEVSALVRKAVKELFPEAGFISEETGPEFIEGAEWTFVLDPIDGTDVYSQGMPCYAVALGILDRNKKPAGCLIDAPRFGVGREELTLSLVPGGVLMVDGHPVPPLQGKDHIEQVTMGSMGQSKMDFSHFGGKVRTFGSSIIHLVSPIVFPCVQACVNQPCYVWDVAAAHAALLSQGMDIVHCSGRPFEYTQGFLSGKEKFPEDIYAGTPKAIGELRRVLPVNHH